MNVYEKLNQARIDFMATGAKMSGNNKFAGYTYFELADILPVVNRLAGAIGFVCEVSFRPELAELVFRNTEKPEEVIRFTSPMSTAALKGCHEVQNLGAVETYIKRYLYQNCFEIVESDALNMTHGKAEPEKKAPPAAAPNPLAVRAGELAKQAGLSDAEKAAIFKDCGGSLEAVIKKIEAVINVNVDKEATEGGLF